MLTSYVREAMRLAEYEKIEDGTYYGEIPGFDGVWANANALDACREELQSVLEDWLILGLRMRHELSPLARLYSTWMCRYSTFLAYSHLFYFKLRES